MVSVGKRLPEELGLEVGVHLKRRRAMRVLVDLIGGAEIRPVRPRLCKGHLAAKVRLRIHPGPRDEVLEQLSGVSFATEQRPEQVDGRRLLHLTGNSQQQAGGELIGCRGSPGLPSIDHGRRVVERPS